jgi:hypothetical protein
LELNLVRNSWLRPRLVRAAWLVTLAILGVVGFIGVEIGPLWLRLSLSTDWRSIGRQTALAFVNGLMVAYVPALIGTVVGTAILAYLRLRSLSRGFSVAASRPLQARLLLLCASALLSLLALEASAAAWRFWLHRFPRLPHVGSPPKTAGKDASAVSLPGAAPSLSSRFPAQVAGTEAAVRPLRILVIGESSARGEPYQRWLSVGHIVAWRLEEVFPGRRIQVDMWAVGGAILEEMHSRLAGLNYCPDALIVYVGHNEFQGRFPWMRDVDYYLDQDGELPSSVSQFFRRASPLRFSPLCKLIMETWDRRRLFVKPPRRVTRQLVDQPLCTAAEAAAIFGDFQQRLEAIASYCERIGTLPIFIIPPSNDGGYDPSRSVLAPETPKSERVAFARAVARARDLEGEDCAEAVRIYRELVERHPEFAETHYRLARLVEHTGCWAEARNHYLQARERDALPLRCPEPLRQAFREVAVRHPTVLLVDGPKVLEAKSTHGIVDDHFFHDAQHPNLHGYVALAEEVINQLGTRRAFGWPAATPVPVVDPAACARHYGIDPTGWADICRAEVWFYQATAYIRYDPEFRNERAEAYLRAIEALREGRDSAEADIPGWPMPPKP